MASDGLKVLYGPTEEDLKNCVALGRQVGPDGQGAIEQIANDSTPKD